MEQFNIRLPDPNWISPGILAKEYEINISTVTNWIKRNQIDYFVFPGVLRGKHLVDRRTAPEKRPVGKPAKKI